MAEIIYKKVRYIFRKRDIVSILIEKKEIKNQDQRHNICQDNLIKENGMIKLLIL